MPQTVKVKIAVAINKYGCWAAHGHKMCGEAMSARLACDDASDWYDGPLDVIWIEADIPCPSKRKVKFVAGEMP